MKKLMLLAVLLPFLAIGCASTGGHCAKHAMGSDCASCCKGACDECCKGDCKSCDACGANKCC